jgi:hypothetical protein
MKIIAPKAMVRLVDLALKREVQQCFWDMEVVIKKVKIERGSKPR